MLFRSGLSKAIRVLPGRLAVLCDPPVTEEGGILVAAGQYSGSRNSDSGTVISSGLVQFEVGDRVGFLPMHGLRCDARNFEWVPDGMEVRIYGVACPVYDSVVKLGE